MDLQINPPMPGKKDYRIGILGSGFIMNDCHLVSYRKAGFNPVAIASRSKENAAKVAERHAIPKVYASYEELLDDPTIEVLDIAVPPNAQWGLIEAACRRKTVKGILAQKPLGMNYAEAVEAVRLCEQAGITLAVNQNMRYDQSVRAAKTLLENGTIGEPVFATIDMRGVPHFMPWQEELGWVTLRIMSIHHIDCLRYWFGDPESIYCSTRPDPRTRFAHTDGICTYILEYQNGFRCVVIDDIWTGPAKEGCPADVSIKWRIEGLNGLALGDIGWCKDPYTSPSSIRYAAKGDKTFHEPKWTESWFPEAFAGTMGQLLIALETKSEPAISGRDNLKTMALVEAAYKSAEQFRSVELLEVEQRPVNRRQIHETVQMISARRGSSNPEASDISQQPLAGFTPRAQQVFKLAGEEAHRLNHYFVGTEHLLLGLIKLGQGNGFTVLVQSGLNLENVRSEVEKQIPKGHDQKTLGNRPYTPRVKKVVALAQKDAKQMGHTYVGTEHILLGLLREGDGIAARVLMSAGVSLENARSALLNILNPTATDNTAAAETPLKKSGNFLGGAVAQSQQMPLLTDPEDTSMSFTPRVLQVIKNARSMVEQQPQKVIGTEHLLLGLLDVKQGVAVNALLKLGLNPEAVRREVTGSSPAVADNKGSGKVTYSFGAQKTFQFASIAARQLNHTYVGTEHILMGLLQDTGPAGAIFHQFGINASEAQIAILRELDPNFGNDNRTKPQ